MDQLATFAEPEGKISFSIIITQRIHLLFHSSSEMAKNCNMAISKISASELS